jgi:phosphoribosylanthranilate isomerase
MENAFRIFLTITKELNKLGISPVLFGSLGVEVATGQEIIKNDVDILVPDVWVGKNWQSLITLMNKMGFVLKDEKEHEFIRNSDIIAFAGDSALSDISLRTHDLISKEIEGVKFLLPTAEQFLLVYRFSEKDGYRLEKRNDRKKIELLELFIKNQMGSKKP